MNCGEKVFKKYGIVFKLPREQFCAKFPQYAKIVGHLYGVMATRKLGNAVNRNYIKRTIRIAVKKEDFANDVWVVIGKKQSS